MYTSLMSKPVGGEKNLIGQQKEETFLEADVKRV